MQMDKYNAFNVTYQRSETNTMTALFDRDIQHYS